MPAVSASGGQTQVSLASGGATPDPDAHSPEQLRGRFMPAVRGRASADAQYWDLESGLSYSVPYRV